MSEMLTRSFALPLAALCVFLLQAAAHAAHAQVPGASLGIASVPNFRDLGGFETRDREFVRAGLVYRSNQLAPIGPADAEKILALQLKSAYDLRTEEERSAHPDELPANVANVWLNVLADEQPSSSARIGSLLRDPKEANVALGGGKAEVLMEQIYRDFVSLPSARSAYRQLFVSLSQPASLPAVFHCTAGKDRTGWAAAALLSLLGVPRSRIMEDYLRSNEYMLPVYQRQTAGFVAAGGDPAIPPALFGVKGQYLQAAFDEMERRYGDVGHYFSEGLGIDAAGQRRLREVLLVTR
jgi:protein-tyrosine phosphatase